MNNYKLHDTIKQFIEKYINLIEQNDFIRFYDKILDDLGSSWISNITEALLLADINPISYFPGMIPKEFLCSANHIDKMPNIADNIRQIGAYAFAYMDNINGSLDLSKTKLEKLGGHCFAGNHFTEIILPDMLAYIGPNCFADCAELKVLQLPKQIQRIQMNAFRDCRELQLVKISLTHQQFLERLGFSSLAFVRVPDECDFQFTDKTIKLKDVWDD